jgi:hypothetical protein
MASIKAIRIRAGNPDVSVLESALVDQGGAATARAAARAALTTVAARTVARKTAFATKVRLLMFQRAVATALTAIRCTEHASAVLAATDVDGAAAASGLDVSCLALAETGGLDSMIAHIARACGPRRDDVVLAALASIKDAADGT